MGRPGRQVARGHRDDRYIHVARAHDRRRRDVVGKALRRRSAAAHCGGIAARIALALHLIAQDCGESLAAAVPEDMVVYLRRSARDPEPSPFLVHRRHLHGAEHRVQDAISAVCERDWNMAALAALGHVTERHLLSLFTDHAGVSPLHYLQTIRLERARQSLAHGASVTHAVEAAGFRSGLHLRRVGPAMGWIAAGWGGA